MIIVYLTIGIGIMNYDYEELNWTKRWWSSSDSPIIIANKP